MHQSRVLASPCRDIALAETGLIYLCGSPPRRGSWAGLAGDLPTTSRQPRSPSTWSSDGADPRVFLPFHFTSRLPSESLGSPFVTEELGRSQEVGASLRNAFGKLLFTRVRGMGVA